MGHSTATDLAKNVWGALYPEEPPTCENGDLEKGGIASKKETGYGELQRVWRELGSSAQIPHLFVATLLATQILKAAAHGSIGSCTLHSMGIFVVYRDLATGGLYILAIKALRGQIAQVDNLKVEVNNLRTATVLVEAAGGNIDEAVKQLVEQIKRNEASAERNEAAAARNEAATIKLEIATAESKAAAAEQTAAAERNEAATAKLEKTERRIAAVTTYLEEVGTPQKQRRRSRSFSGSPTRPT